jgi:hypothetical protein
LTKGLSTIDGLIELTESIKNKGGRKDSLQAIFGACLLSERNVRQFLQNIEAISTYRYNFYNDTESVKAKETSAFIVEVSKKVELKDGKSTKGPLAEHLDKFFDFFPFWDTKFASQNTSSREDAVFLRKLLKINVPDSQNFSQVLKCQTLRELVTFYQQNRESQNIPTFTQDEISKLEQRGLEMSKIEAMKELVMFLAKLSKQVPSSLFNYLSSDHKKYKIDLRGVTNGRVSCVASLFAAAINLNHPICRVDIT